MFDSLSQKSTSVAETQRYGAKLSQTLYGPHDTIALDGPMGSGKTTFIQGCARALGMTQYLTSPTYALEQRYRTADGRAFLHLDLYRLTPADASALLDDYEPEEGSIRCIEWAERSAAPSNGMIQLSFGAGDTADERTITYLFGDEDLPDDAWIKKLYTDVMLPEHIIDHCHTVADVVTTLADDLIAHGYIIRKEALRKAALLHDVLRFVDFKDGTSHVLHTVTQQQRDCWHIWKDRFAGKRHEAACSALLQEEGYPILAAIVETHGVTSDSSQRSTIEQDILYYSDKRVALDQVVTLQERFDDFRQRYGDGVESDRAALWLREATAMEQELFPDGVPV